MKILFVCMGNICRSPTAEGVMARLVSEAELGRRVGLDSAGTIDYHAGDPPDPRAQTHASKRGYDLSKLRGRQVTPEDFARFDLILAMDRRNLADLLSICPEAEREKVRLFMEFARAHPEREVPDPYYGGAAGFDRVLDMIEDAAAGLLEHVRNRLGTG